MAERKNNMTREEFKTKAKEVIDICNKYGFMTNTIMPYGFKMTVEELTKNWADYDRCTNSSKAIMRDELKGFLPILEHWVAYENEPIIKVRIIDGAHKGDVKEYHKSTADLFIESGMAEMI